MFKTIENIDVILKARSSLLCLHHILKIVYFAIVTIMFTNLINLLLDALICCPSIPFLLLALSIIYNDATPRKHWEWGFSWREPQFMMWVGGLWLIVIWSKEYFKQSFGQKNISSKALVKRIFVSYLKFSSSKNTTVHMSIHGDNLVEQLEKRIIPSPCADCVLPGSRFMRETQQSALQRERDNKIK